jgi:hypothetical protein
MAYGTTRLVIRGRVQARLGDPPAGGTARWSTSTLDALIGDAVLECEPLGDPVVVTMTGTAYATSPHVPAQMLRVDKVETKISAGYWSPIFKYLWEFQPGQALWLKLRNEPVASEELRIHGIQRYTAPSADASVIAADTELVILYTCALAHETVQNYSQVSSRRDDQDKALLYRQQAENRKMLLLGMQVDDDAPQPQPQRQRQQSTRGRR